jgi:hypothetical protein
MFSVYIGSLYLYTFLLFCHHKNNKGHPSMLVHHQLSAFHKQPSLLQAHSIRKVRAPLHLVVTEHMRES